MNRLHFVDCRVRVESFEMYDEVDCDDAELWVEGEALLVSYFDDDGIVVLEGWPEDDRWKLAARSRPRRAFLRPMAEDDADSSASYREIRVGMRLAGEIEEQGAVADWSLEVGALEPS